MEKFIHDLLSEEIIKDALRFYNVSNYKNLGGFENFVFEFESSSGFYILRLSHSSHRSYEQVASELDFIYYLAQNHANVSIPIRNINDNFIEKIACEDGSYFTVAAFEKARGQRPTKDLINNEVIINYGKTIGRFHKLTKAYEPNESIEKRFSWDNDVLFSNIGNFLQEKDQIIYDGFLELKDQILELPKSIDNYGLLHTDVHFGNFFIDNNDLCVFDFDDSSYQYFISDIAIALFYYISSQHDDEVRISRADNFMTYFMNGYLQENYLSKDDYMKIDLFLKLREYVLYFVIYRSCDLETDEWAKRFIGFYRNRLIKGIRFVELDFNKYYKTYN